ncbi:2-octaprenyl-6-methoxyphenol hydroxylase [Rhodovulum imhoffii]|uniref:2-octaprenyl-6-methoxyphenol hydroxylase n=1 Tax=Rhodovulum imhoffii TaxID=365340 RepID=A0A2T5BQM8_9RHOB|nr:UbiH/UbiF family hydroxylase [Rhodovulum imhoffii]MBK5933911.1 2-octaprenyl-6-methoxyphenyl hydroxylase [Rhodovulum imhoffii]PTN01501.1 2-octaprenyl-6-methoxyphenol hydroxylase [Rhodovulum imhoffii]
MTRITTDILISGGGVAGLAAAAAFGSAGFSILCVDPAAPVTEEAAEGADLRTTAFLQPSREVLEAAGLWARLAPHASNLQIMRIVDAGGKTPAPRLTRDFNASEISDQPFGWNLPNWLLRREMLARLEELPNVTFRAGVGTRDVLTRTSEARITLTDGTQVSARLLVAADGRNSPVRETLGIGIRTMRYGQKALAFAVTHPQPHDNISTEIHRSGGPFTLVPLPDRNGKPCSAIVWMERGPQALRLAALPEAEFNAEMTARSGGVYGPLVLASRRTVWPIISQIAKTFHGQRTALIAETAHVVPPIGAQGLNMSLADIRVLLELAQANPAGLGDERMLETYTRRRRPEVLARVTGIDMLNRASMRGEPVLRNMRATAIAALYSLRPVRKTLMRAGLGAKGA